VPEAGVPLGSVCATLAGGGLGEDPLAPVGAKFVELAVEGLVGGTNSCVADELHVVISFWFGRPVAGMAKSRTENRLRDVDCGTDVGLADHRVHRDGAGHEGGGAVSRLSLVYGSFVTREREQDWNAARVRAWSGPHSQHFRVLVRSQVGWLARVFPRCCSTVGRASPIPTWTTPPPS